MVAVSTGGKLPLQWHACSCSRTPLGQYRQSPKVAEAARRGPGDLRPPSPSSSLPSRTCHVLNVGQITLRLNYMSQFSARLDSSTMSDFSPCLAFYHPAKAPISANGHSSEPPLAFASKFGCFVSSRLLSVSAVSPSQPAFHHQPTSSRGSFRMSGNA